MIGHNNARLSLHHDKSPKRQRRQERTGRRWRNEALGPRVTKPTGTLRHTGDFEATLAPYMPKTMAPPTPTNPTRPATTLASTPQGLLTYPAPAALDAAPAADEAPERIAEEAPDALAAADEVMDARTDEAEETTEATEEEAPATTDETEALTPPTAELALEATEEEAEACRDTEAKHERSIIETIEGGRGLLGKCCLRPTRKPMKGLQKRWPH